MRELYSPINKNSGKKFEDAFLVKLANKGTTLTLRARLLPVEERQDKKSRTQIFWSKFEEDPEF